LAEAVLKRPPEEQAELYVLIMRKYQPQPVDLAWQITENPSVIMPHLLRVLHLRTTELTVPDILLAVERISCGRQIRLSNQEATLDELQVAVESMRGGPLKSYAKETLDRVRGCAARAH